MINIKNEQEIIDKGFYQCDVPAFSRANKMWQKRYKDGKNTKYFLNIDYYKLTHPTTREDLSGYEISSQVYLKGNHNAVNLTFLDSSIEEAEATIDKMFEDGILENYE